VVFDDGIRFESECRPGNLEHQKVRGTVSDCDCLSEFNSFGSGEFSEYLVFSTVEQGTFDIPSHCFVFHHQTICDNVFDCDSGLFERCLDAPFEPSGDNGDRDTRLAEIGDHVGSATSKFPSLKGGVDSCFRHAFKERHSLSKCRSELHLTSKPLFREPADLAASLPMEIEWYMTGAIHQHGQRFDWSKFVERVSEIEQTDPSDAAYHACVVIDIVHTLVPESDFQQLRDTLPESEDDENWRKLFEIVDAGGWGESEEAQTGGGPQPEATSQDDETDGGPSEGTE